MFVIPFQPLIPSVNWRRKSQGNKNTFGWRLFAVKTSISFLIKVLSRDTENDRIGTVSIAGADLINTKIQNFYNYLPIDATIVGKFLATLSLVMLWTSVNCTYHDCVVRRQKIPCKRSHIFVSSSPFRNAGTPSGENKCGKTLSPSELLVVALNLWLRQQPTQLWELHKNWFQNWSARIGLVCAMPPCCHVFVRRCGTQIKST